MLASATAREFPQELPFLLSGHTNNVESLFKLVINVSCLTQNSIHDYFICLIS